MITNVLASGKDLKSMCTKTKKQVNILIYSRKKNNKTLVYRGFQQNPIGDYEIVLKGPKLSLVGSYDVTGKALLLPIQGDGWSNITTCKLFLIL